MPAPHDNIKHLIVLMLENRSFDHMFGYLTINQPKVPGDAIDGVEGDEMNVDSKANIVLVSNEARFAGDYRADPGHHFPDVTYQLFEKDQVASTAKPTLGGFVQELRSSAGRHLPDVAERDEVLRSAQASGPDGAGAGVRRVRPVVFVGAGSHAAEPRVRSCGDLARPRRHEPDGLLEHQHHLRTARRTRGVVKGLQPRRQHAGVHVQEPVQEGRQVARLGTQRISDLKGNNLPKYCFLEPRFNDWYDEGNHRYYIANDQHPDNNVAEGELLIHEIYQAIRKSKYWEKCLFVITYDEHGGFFDHVEPPRTIPPGGAEHVSPTFDFARLGVRVPTVLISPYIEKGTILHDQYEHSSLAATARELLAPNMAPLTDRDRNANSFANALTLTVPRDDTPKKLDMKVDGVELRPTDIDTNTHGSATLSDQQRNQVLAAYMMDLDRPAGERVIGNGDFSVLEDINTEQKAAVYIQVVEASLVNP